MYIISYLQKENKEIWPKSWTKTNENLYQIIWDKNITKIFSIKSRAKRKKNLKHFEQKNVKENFAKKSWTKMCGEIITKKSRAKIQGKSLPKISGKNIRENQ